MKATDLMCGDWVLINGNPRKIQAIDNIDEEIRADDDLYYVGEDRYHSENKTEGIPITPEILEKNGWHWGLTSSEEKAVSFCGDTYDEHWTYDKGAGEISLTFPENTKGGLLKIDDQRFNRHLKFVWNDTLYIHELQRVLRFCGLNELADNFKFRKMETIEERAKEAGTLSQFRVDYCYDKKSVELGYIQGAEEQKALDIDKACQWLKENVECGVHPQRAYGFPDMFRKAMEE